MVFSSIRRRLSTIRTSARSSTTSTVFVSPEAPAERLILVYGNCQAHWLAGLMAAQGLGLVCIVGQPFGFFPEFQGIRPLFVSAQEAAEMALSAKLAGRQVALLEQTAPMHAGLETEVLRTASQVVRFPHLEMRSYWHPWLTQSEKGFEPDRIQRQFAFDLAAMRRSEAKAGWDRSLVDYIEQSHGQTPHFYTLNHPTADLMQRLHAGISAQLEVRGELDRAMYEWAQTEIALLQGIGFIAEHPLHDSVINALSLEWARTGWYRLWQQAYFVAAAGDHDRALALLTEAASDPEHDPHIYFTMGSILAERDPSAAARAFGRAYRAYPQSPIYARLWLEQHLGQDSTIAARLQAELAQRLPAG